jgi:citronellol/citronellal dehydrogenase
VEEQCTDAIDRAVKHFGRLDGLVNNAGAIHWAPVASWTSKKFDLVTGVNVRAAFLCSRAAIPHLRKQGGTIVMMSPPINPKAAVGKGPYLVSKIGMTMLALAIDGEEANVHACALWPITAIQTAATENFKMGTPKEWRKPDILADATIALLAKDPKKAKYRAWLDEEVLAEEGVTDFTKYRCDPTSEPSPMSIALVDPDWRRA